MTDVTTQHARLAVRASDAGQWGLARIASATAAGIGVQ